MAKQNSVFCIKCSVCLVTTCVEIQRKMYTMTQEFIYGKIKLFLCVTN
jgi:hypothetical protein